MSELLGKAQLPSDEHPMGVTVDGVPITPGLVVFTNEYRVGTVGESHRHSEGWFDVLYPDGRMVMQNPERVATVFEGKRAVLDECSAARTGEGYWTCDVPGGCADCRTLAHEVEDTAQIAEWNTQRKATL